ncbi:MAG TPA: SDR family NAD(P)-dependent oxidoreductase [Gemmatimonadales bacterium]|nr:SDR family NAD(P)-dependent oxidoreductase [Gemmatimonadales bacterium]
MSDLLGGRTIVVTGGSMGIGLACAEECVREGASVVICARGEKDLAGAVEHLRSLSGVQVRGVRADVTDAVHVGRVLAEAASIGRLDGVVHCAGVYGPIGPMVRVDAEEWRRAIDVNLFGTFLVAQQACQSMIAAGSHGSIVLMSGGGAASPFPNYTAYACGKVGVVRLAETLALEMAPHGIRVNAVAPGFVITRLHEQTLGAGKELAGDFVETTRQQIAKGGVPPTVAARCAAFLLSERSGGITGRFVAAPYDGYAEWPAKLEAIKGSDLFTLRRIVPRDRGMDWQ